MNGFSDSSLARFDVALFVPAPKGHGKIARGFQPLGPECERGPGAGSPWLLTIAPVGARKPRNIKTGASV